MDVLDLMLDFVQKSLTHIALSANMFSEKV